MSSMLQIIERTYWMIIEQFRLTLVACCYAMRLPLSVAIDALHYSRDSVYTVKS